MIYERSFFIISYVTLSSLVSYSGSLATESTEHKSNTLFSNVITKVDIDTIDQKRENFAEYSYTHDLQAANQIKAQDQEKSQNKLQQKTEELNNQTNQEKPEKFNKRWSLIGIFITSILFLVVLWMLFQKEPQNQNQDQDNSDKLLPSQDQDIFNLVDDDSGILEEEEIISSELFPMLSKNILEDLSHNSTENVTSSASNDDDTDNTYGEKYLQEDLDEMAESSQAQALSDTTEIDVVFELIKDLQQSDRELRHRAIRKLSRTGDFRGIEPLTSIISQADTQEKNLIINAITQIANRSFEPLNNALFPSLEDENSEVRKNAIHDLTALHECISQITKCLVLQMLEDSDQEVQQTAKWALEKFKLLLLPSIAEDYEESFNKNLAESGSKTKQI